MSRAASSSRGSKTAKTGRLAIDPSTVLPGAAENLTEDRASFGEAEINLAMPMGGQFEQELNAILLADEGYGKNGREMTDETIGDFLYRLPDYERRLKRYVGEDNSRIQAKLDELLRHLERQSARSR